MVASFEAYFLVNLSGTTSSTETTLARSLARYARRSLKQENKKIPRALEDTVPDTVSLPTFCLCHRNPYMHISRLTQWSFQIKIL